MYTLFFFDYVFVNFVLLKDNCFYFIDGEKGKSGVLNCFDL